MNKEQKENQSEGYRKYREYHNAYLKRWRKNNPKYLASHREQVKKWYRENPEEGRKRSNQNYWKHREQRLKHAKEYRKRCKEKIFEADRKPQRRIGKNLRSRIINALVRQDSVKSKRIRELIGTSISELKSYLEKQFKPGMSWENYGLYGWHVDHRLPLISFDLTDPEEQKKAFHYTNLQPLWAKENHQKRSKILN
jgi:hypothetical protein